MRNGHPLISCSAKPFGQGPKTYQTGPKNCTPRRVPTVKVTSVQGSPLQLYRCICEPVGRWVCVRGLTGTACLARTFYECRRRMNNCDSSQFECPIPTIHPSSDSAIPSRFATISGVVYGPSVYVLISVSLWSGLKYFHRLTS